MIDNIYFKCFNHFCVCECNPLILCLEDKLPNLCQFMSPKRNIHAQLTSNCILEGKSL